MGAKSEVYSAFLEEFVKLRGHHKLINTISNPQLQLPSQVSSFSEGERREAQYSVYGAAFISLLAKWEGYVQDFLEEMLRKVVSLICEKEPSQLNKKQAELLEKALEEWHKNEHKGQKKPTAQALSRQLIVEQDKWKDILQSYATAAFKGCSPVFHGDKGIAQTFKQLFLIDVKLTEEMLSQWKPLHPMKLACIINGPKPDREPILDLDNAESLETIAKLIYGVRCVLVHPKNDKTFNYGALSGFPDESNFSKQMGRSDPRATRQFYTFFTRAEAVYKKTAEPNRLQIYYCDIVNLQRYILLVAARFHNTVVKLVEKHYQLHVWQMVQEPSP